MIPDPNPATWMGFALRRKDGTVDAYEFTDREMIEFTIAYEQLTADSPVIVTVTMRGIGGHRWQRGAEQAPPAPQAIDAGQRAIEGDTTAGTSEAAGTWSWSCSRCRDRSHGWTSQDNADRAYQRHLAEVHGDTTAGGGEQQ